MHGAIGLWLVDRRDSNASRTVGWELYLEHECDRRVEGVDTRGHDFLHAGRDQQRPAVVVRLLQYGPGLFRIARYLGQRGIRTNRGG